MSFINPYLLWALLAVLVPVIVHLFNFRIYKTVYFSNTSFLSSIRNASKSKSKLKNLIVLLLRILTIIALVIAFARPFIPNKNNSKTNNNVVSIYLDNSFSMNASGEYGNLFDAAKERARLLVSLFDNNQQFLFLTNDLKAEHRNVTNKKQLNKFISECRLSYSRKNMVQLLDYNKKLLSQNIDEEKLNNSVYLVSDFQKNISNFNKLQPDSNTNIFCIPVATNKINNIYIDSVWFASPGRHRNKQENLQVKIVNKGNEDYTDILLSLNVAGKQKMVNNFGINANSSKTLSLNFTNTETGILPSYLEVTDYPITYDNKLYFNYEINPKTKILIINQKLENKYLNSLFKSDSNCIVKNYAVDKVRSSEFVNYQLIITNELSQFSTGLLNELNRFVAKGGTLLCLPPNNLNIADFNKLTELFNLGKFANTKQKSTKIGKINYEHYIYKNVFAKIQNKPNLSELKNWYKFHSDYNTLTNSLLTDVSGNNLLIQAQYKRGKVYLFTFSLDTDNSNFVTHPIFVPTIYNIAAFSQSDETIYYTIAKSQIVELDLKSKIGEDMYKIVGVEKNVEFIPQMLGKGEFGIRLSLMNNIYEAGNFLVKNNGDTIASISFNYNRQESDIEHYSNSDILEQIELHKLDNMSLFSGNVDELKIKISDTIKERSELWKWFIILAIACLIAEILVVRLFKEEKNE